MGYNDPIQILTNDDSAVVVLRKTPNVII